VHIIPFEETTSEQLRELSVIHIRVIPYSINARLGMEHLHELYALFKDSNEIFGFTALEQNRAVGLVLSSRNFKVTSLVSKPLRKIMIRRIVSARYLLNNFSNLVDFAIVAMKITRRFPESSYLMLWYVDETYSGGGLGRILLDKFENEAKDRNFSSVVVDVRHTSKVAISGYVKSGFTQFSETLLSRILVKSLE
jgi:ribosomal protein S18 acetylase RimI-like enzyme